MATTTGHIDYTEGTVPSTPSASHQRFYINSTSHAPKLVNSSGVEKYFPGYELDYVAFTSGVSVTGTTEAGATTIVTGTSITYDGNTAVIIEFFAPSVATPTAAASNYVQVWLYDGSSSIGSIGVVVTTAAAAENVSLRVARRLTPSNAAHAYGIRCSVPNTTGGPIVNAGAGGTGVYVPGYIRITAV